jgi:cell shape-determining protein MreC
MLYFNPKKNFRKNSPKLYYTIWLASLIIFIIIVWLLSKVVLAKSSKNIPMAKKEIVADMFSSKKDLLAKISDMQALIDSYRARESLDLALEDENQKLKAELGRIGKQGGILANIVTDPQYSLYDTLVIDAGSNDDINVGQNVYAFDGILLGEVTKVDTNRSVVSLFSQSGKETYGNTLTNDVAVTLIGRGGGEYEVRMPRDMYFEVGELISAQSTSTAILAKIEKIATDARDPFQRLLAKAPINLQNLKWVIVK